MKPRLVVTTCAVLVCFFALTACGSDNNLDILNGTWRFDAEESKKIAIPELKKQNAYSESNVNLLDEWLAMNTGMMLEFDTKAMTVRSKTSAGIDQIPLKIESEDKNVVTIHMFRMSVPIRIIDKSTFALKYKGVIGEMVFKKTKDKFDS